MLLERPMPVHAAGVSDDLAPGHRASSGFSEARFFEASGHTVLIGHPKLKPDAIIAVSCRSSRTTQFQTAESPQNSGRFSSPSGTLFEPPGPTRKAFERPRCAALCREPQDA